MKGAGLIAAAGRSRRMEGFKPLLEINGFPMIAMTVQSMENAGIRDITVVVGYRGEEVRRALKALEVKIVENPFWQDTDMLASVKLGLEAVDRRQGVFFSSRRHSFNLSGNFSKAERGDFGSRAGNRGSDPCFRREDLPSPLSVSCRLSESTGLSGQPGTSGSLWRHEDKNSRDSRCRGPDGR